MADKEIQEDWLFTNVLVAFVGALLLGQAWEASEGTVKLAFVIRVTDYTGFVIFLIIAGFFVLSLFLAVASVIPRFRISALSIGKGFSTTLEFMVWIAFILSWLSAIPELSPSQWWSQFLIVGGFGFVIFMPVRMLLRLLRS